MPARVSSSLQVSDNPFTFLRPKLLSHKGRHQVVLSVAQDAESGEETPCVVKFFSPNARHAFQRELSVYSYEGTEDARPQKLWSGAWPSSEYLEFLRNLPSVLRKSDGQVYALVLTYVESIDSLAPSQPTELQKHAVKAALLSLRRLHSVGIVHGDISVENLLLQQNGHNLEATWIDFSSSSVQASMAMIEQEWEQAITYFSQLVCLAHRDRC